MRRVLSEAGHCLSLRWMLHLQPEGCSGGCRVCLPKMNPQTLVAIFSFCKNKGSEVVRKRKQPRRKNSWRPFSWETGADGANE